MSAGEQWSRKDVLVAIVKWKAETGEVPSCNDLRGQNVLYSSGRFPSDKTVRSRFGSMGDAAFEAGRLLGRSERIGEGGRGEG